jgi:hypothetical protein
LNNKNNCLTEALKKLVDIQNKPVKETSPNAVRTRLNQLSQNASNVRPQPTSSVLQEKKQIKRYELGPKEKCYVKIDDFYDENGEEISFEEKRAKALRPLERNSNENAEEESKNSGKEENNVITEYNIPIRETSPICKFYYIYIIIILFTIIKCV